MELWRATLWGILLAVILAQSCFILVSATNSPTPEGPSFSAPGGGALLLCGPQGEKENPNGIVARWYDINLGRLVSNISVPASIPWTGPGAYSSINLTTKKYYYLWMDNNSVSNNSYRLFSISYGGPAGLVFNGQCKLDLGPDIVQCVTRSSTGSFYAVVGPFGGTSSYLVAIQGETCSVKKLSSPQQGVVVRSSQTGPGGQCLFLQQSIYFLGSTRLNPTPMLHRFIISSGDHAAIKVYPEDDGTLQSNLYELAFDGYHNRIIYTGVVPSKKEVRTYAIDAISGMDTLLFNNANPFPMFLETYQDPTTSESYLLAADLFANNLVYSWNGSVEWVGPSFHGILNCAMIAGLEYAPNAR